MSQKQTKRARKRDGANSARAQANPTTQPVTAPKRAAFTISISWDPNTEPIPHANMQQVGEGAIYQQDVLTAFVQLRDEFLLARAREELQKLNGEFQELATEVAHLKAGPPD